jgi:SAM-dependent methyltransferase
MDMELAVRLAALPHLSADHARSAARPCKVCGKPAPFFDVTDFWKGSRFFPYGPSGIPVAYHRCDACGFMFAPLFDDWASEDFQKYIYNDEYIAVDSAYADVRPKHTATEMAKSLAGFEDARMIDYGSGTGLFANHMRAAGFKNITNFDPFSDPVRPSGRFDIITCFEVIEHSPTPLETLRDIASLLNDDGCVVLGESLQPPDIDVVRCNWWYCMPRNGHISLYTDRSLALLATRAGLLFHPGKGMHTFSRPVSGRFADLACRTSPALLPISLGAPQSTSKPEAIKPRWQGVETFSGGPTRWTAEADLCWNVAVPPARSVLVRIRVPFAVEVRPGFATESRLLVDGIEQATSVSDRSIIAEVRVEGRASIDVTLRTPPVVSPSSLRNSADHRLLGLAIPCEDAL